MGLITSRRSRTMLFLGALVADVGIGVVELCAPASRSTGAIPMDAGWFLQFVCDYTVYL